MNTTLTSWSDAIGAEKQQPYFVALWQRIKQARQAGLTIYPPADEVFSAFGLTDFAQVKVVILGQDPYHGPEHAHGLASSQRLPYRLRYAIFTAS